MPRWLKNYFVRKFFCPTEEFDASTPAEPIAHEAVSFPGKDNRRLTGYFLRSAGPARGTVIHCHGNTGRVDGHLPLLQFLVEENFQVLAFDYGGYGKSEGEPSPASIIDDALAAVAYCRQRADVDKNKIALFGQSLGGMAAAGAMARDPHVKCLVLEGTFPTYLEMAKETGLGKLLFFITPFVIPDIGPRYDLQQLGSRRVLLVHGEADEVVPFHFAGKLNAAFPRNASLLLFKNLRHLDGAELEPGYRQGITDFLKKNC